MKKLTKIVSYILCLSFLLYGCKFNKSQTTSVEDTSSQVQITSEEDISENVTELSTEDIVAESNYKYANMTAEEIVATLTLEQKAAQMVQPAIYEVNHDKMLDNCYGSILSKTETVGYLEWQEIVDSYQECAVNSEAGIPYIYGQDDVHGVNYCADAVYFPHNIGLGAANDPELMYEIGLATADEAKLCHMIWNFAPCVALSVDPRWGRTYESYGADLEIVSNLGESYTKGLIDGGVIACAKHFFGDGNVLYGTGENSDTYRIIDRGDAVLSDEEINQLLSVYQAQIDAGVQTIMISHSALNGVKMHENGQYIWMLKEDMGFEGFIVSDWNSVQNTSGATYEEQVIKSVNSGIDMFMEVDRYDETMQIIIDGVNEGKIEQSRVDDAVTRILKVKIDSGVVADPFFENMTTVQSETGSAEYRELAIRAVEESLVLLKNENDLLPLKSGTKVYVTGPAADHSSAQCGGWTIDWTGSYSKDISGVTTILEGLKQVAPEYNLEIITDSDRASEADVVLLVVGEEAYAEWLGDTEDLDLCGSLGLSGNYEAIKETQQLNKPVVTCVVAGRQVIIDQYYNNWDSVVMCYLPGSEGRGVANVLLGKTNFSGKLPSPWYNDLEQIGTDECWLPQGYGLSY